MLHVQKANIFTLAEAGTRPQSSQAAGGRGKTAHGDQQHAVEGRCIDRDTVARIDHDGSAPDRGGPAQESSKPRLRPAASR